MDGETLGLLRACEEISKRIVARWVDPAADESETVWFSQRLMLLRRELVEALSEPPPRAQQDPQLAPDHARRHLRSVA